jgi:hypothetical protein
MNPAEHLQYRIDSESSPEGLHEIFQELKELEWADELLDALDDIRLHAFHAAQRTTLEAPEHARGFILNQLLALCLRADSEWRRPPKVNRYRNLLKDWIDELPWPWRSEIREAVLTNAVSELGGIRVRSACWTIAALSFRSPAVVVGLGQVISSRDDEIGDVAFAVRSGLGADPDERATLINELVRRIALRWNISLVTAVQNIPDQGVLDALVASWFQPERFREEAQKSGVLIAITVPLIAAIADAANGDISLQEAAWRHLLRLSELDMGIFRHHVLLDSSVFRRIDDSAIVQYYLKALGEEEPRSRFLLYLRLEECIRPRQLKGWHKTPSNLSLEILQTDALTPIKMMGAFTTEEFRRKRDAWSVLLALGMPEILPQWDHAIEADQNGYVIAEILEFAACFRQSPLPRVVPELLAMRFGDLRPDQNQQFTAHIAAVRVAHAALTEEAFRAILAFQPMTENGVLISIVEALSDVAAALIREGRQETVNELWMCTRPDAPDHVRSASVGAIARLIRIGVIGAEAAQIAFERVDDREIDIFARRELLESLAYFPRGTLPDDILARVRSLAFNRLHHSPSEGLDLDEKMLGEAALAVLASQGILSNDQSLLQHSLGFRPINGGWELSSTDVNDGIVPHVTGVLLADFPEQFTPAASQLIRDAGVRGLYQISRFLRTARDRLPQGIIDALVDRACLMDFGRTAEPEVLFLLARISAKRFLCEPWARMEEWLPQARSALADALAMTGTLTEELAEYRRRLFIRLIGDGLFGVRRATYRGLAEVDPYLLANFCVAWAEGDATLELRRRAAEGAGWLPEDLLAAGVHALAWDPEASVRDAWGRSCTDRRDRWWAAQCLERVLAVREPEEIYKAWAYGRALQKLGDDRSVEQLERHAHDPDLPPSVRNWLNKIVSKTRSRWEDVTRKWPQPWFARRGVLESVRGIVRGPKGDEHMFDGCLWITPGESLSELTSWGGWCVSHPIPLEESSLEIAGRAPARIVILRTNFGGGPTFFVGSGPYPEAR